jgi:hypothetical protein
VALARVPLNLDPMESTLGAPLAVPSPASPVDPVASDDRAAAGSSG